MSGRRRSTGIWAAGLALLCVCLTSGCVSLQQDGTITKVQEQDAGAAQVQIWPSPPSPGESAEEIVSGFLEAARSGASNQKIAADYLTPDMKKQWQSEQNTVIVLADYSEGSPQDPAESGQEGPNDPNLNTGADDSGAPKVVEEVAGTVVGQLAANGLYSAQSRSTTYSFTVDMTKSGYRIARLPGDFGVLMERSDFESFYSRHVVYYQNPQPDQQGRLMPAQVYLPSVDSDQQVAAQVAALVVQGVPTPLSSMMQNAVDGADYLGMQVDNNGHAVVKIKANKACATTVDPCDQLAQQLAQTLGGLSTKYVSVQVTDTSSGRTTQPPAVSTSPLSDYGFGSPLRADAPRPFYAISLTGQLEQLDTSGVVQKPSIAFQDSKTLFHSVTAQSGGTELQDLALVSQDQSTLYVPQRQNGVERLATVYPATGTAAGGKVGDAGWDESGNLWFTVAIGGEVKVYRYDEGSRSLDQVAMEGPSGTLEEVLPAPDGDRVAVRYIDSAGQQWIDIAAVTQTDGEGYAVNLDQAEVVAAGWNAITDFDWYNESSLAVLGMQPNSQEPGLYEIYTDGSAVYDSLTSQPVQASPPSQANGFVWTAQGQPIATSVNQGKNTLYTLSVEGEDAQPLKLTGSSPTY